MKKRLLSLVLIACVIVSMVPASVLAYNDVPADATYYDAVRLLSTLGIVKGYDEYTFGPDRDVTRAEFTTLLIRAMDMETLAKSLNVKTDFPFEDCTGADIEYALPNILLAYNKGIILGVGDGQFAPTANVKYEEAVKMIVCAAGYEIRATEQGGWPMGYINAAQEMRILGDVSGEIGVPAKRWQIAQLLYNLMPVALMQKITTAGGQPSYIIEENKTWLSEYLQLHHSTGQLVADPVTSVSPNSWNCKVGECVIDDDADNREELFKTGGISVNSMVGKSVEFYYSKNSNNKDKTLIFIDLMDTGASTLINVEDIEDLSKLDPFSTSTIRYWANRETDTKTKSITVAANPVIVLNGKTYVPNSAAEFAEEMNSLVSGHIEFVDSKSSGNIDKLFITKIQTYVVKSITTDSATGKKTINDLYRNTNQQKGFEIDEQDTSKVITIKNKAGNTVSLSSISANNVLEIKESKSNSGRNLLDITVVTDTISGTISEVSDDEVTISGRKYEVSKYYDTYAIKNDPNNKLILNMSATFYLDSAGKITAINKTTQTTRYGYIYASGMDDMSNNDTLIIKLIDNSGSKKSYTVTKRITYDGSSKTPADGLTHLKKSAAETNYDMKASTRSEIISQPIKYQLDSSGNLQSIVTVQKQGTQVAPDTLNKSDLDYQIDGDGAYEKLKYSYVSSIGSFKSSTGKKVDINSSTVLYVVPSNRADDTAKKGSTSDLKNNESYVFEAFDVNSGIAGAAVVYKEQPLATIDESTPSSIITEMSNKLNNGENATQYSCYQVATSFSTALKTGLWTASESTFSNVKLGDVIKTVTDQEGYVRDDDGVEMVWNVNTPAPVPSKYVNKPVAHVGGYYATVVGYVYSVDVDQSRIAIMLMPEDGEELNPDNKIYYTIGTNCGILEFTGGLDKPVSAKSGLEDVASTIKAYEDGVSEPTEVLLHLYTSSSATIDNMTPRLMYIIKRDK